LLFSSKDVHLAYFQDMNKTLMDQSFDENKIMRQ
jgi:hypothetical protein